MLQTGGEVEDTRLETKAKDTKKFEAKDISSEERSSRNLGQECSRLRPRTKDTMWNCFPKKKFFTHKFANFPQNSSIKNYFPQIPWRAPRQNNIAHDLGPFSTSQKIVLSSSRGQNIFEVRGQGQRLKIVFSRGSSRPKT